MNIRIWDYWQILIKYTNPVHILTGTLLYIALFFIIMLALVLVFRKRILVKRQHPLLKYLSYAYLIVLPILAGFFGFKFGLANALEKDLIQHVDTYAASIENTFVSDSASILNAILSGDTKMAEKIPGVSVNNSVDVLTYLLYDTYGLSLERTAGQNNSLTSKVAGLFLKVTKSQIISIMVKKTLHNLLSEKMGMGEEFSDKLMKTKINEFIKHGIFKEIAVIQIQNIFGGIKKSVITLLALILAASIIEIGIAHYLLKKNEKQEI